MELTLDNQLRQLATEENIKHIYLEYEKIKTDTFYDPPRIKIKMGTDGIDEKNFKNNLTHNCKNISKRLKNGNYYFKPLREVHIPKAKTKEDFRVLSIASISDIIVQKLLYQCIQTQAEGVFSQLGDVSFAYRVGKSAPQAAIKLKGYINEGYNYVFDADIKKFFDTIPHPLLERKLLEFLGSENPLTFKILRRYIHVDRVVPDNYIHKRGKEKIFQRKKPTRTKRENGIAQGGVISGLLANIYMHEFDKWVLYKLKKKYDLKYIRYADDFLILLKNAQDHQNMKKEVANKLEELGLRINSDKTNPLIDLTERGKFVEYVGFSISQQGIRIKKENIANFKLKITEILNMTDITGESIYSINLLISRITFKLLGNETLGLKYCDNCGKYEAHRSWLNYFTIITDIQQLRALDTWIRKQIYYWYYKKTGKRLKATDLKLRGLIRLEEIYRKAKKQSNKKEICFCEPLVDKKNRKYLIQALFNHHS